MPFFQNQKKSDRVFLNAANQTTLQVRSPRNGGGNITKHGEKRVWGFSSFCYFRGEQVPEDLSCWKCEQVSEELLCCKCEQVPEELLCCKCEQVPGGSLCGEQASKRSLRHNKMSEDSFGQPPVLKNQSNWNRRSDSQKQGAVNRDYLQMQVAAVSVEAALALSIFIFSMVCMMIPFRMMERQRQVQAVLESVNEKLCQYAYLEYMLSNGEEIPKEDGDWKQDLLLGIVNGAAGIGAGMMAEDMFCQEGMDNHTFLRSSFLKDGETIAFRMDYRMRMPFSILNLKSLPFTSASTRRAWIGRDGLSFEENGSQENEEDPIVYIGKYSTRYHKSRECHYLANRMQSVDYDAISKIRNKSGGKYYPCAVCGSSAASGSTVYIMESGSRYHTTSGCTAIIAYVQAVKLSEVEHLGGCSYCSR